LTSLFIVFVCIASTRRLLCPPLPPTLLLPCLLLLLPRLLLLLLQVAEVEVLKTLTQQELAAFAQEVLAAGSPARRKVAVLIRGSQEFTAGQQQQDGTCPAPSSSDSKAAGDSTPGAAAAAAAEEGAGTCSAAEAEAGVCSSSSSGADDVAYVSTAVPAGEQFLLIRDVSAFKRSCEVWPAPQQHSKQHKRQAVLSGQGTAAASAADAAGEAAAAAQSEEAVPGAAKL
jgi:hypothetical protein